MAVSSTFTTSLLTHEHVAAVLAIADTQFGAGYLSEKRLLDYIDREDHFGQVVLEQQQVLGFSLMQLLERSVLAARMHEAEQWFLAYFAAYERLGFRSLTAVAPHAQGQGIASCLVREGLQLLSKHVSVVVCDAWQAPDKSIANVLLRNGYRALQVLPDFWKTDSLAQGYHCERCGAPPCRCTAVVYGCFFEPVATAWWARPDLHYQQKRLHWAGHDLLAFSQNKATPFYVYSLPRIQANYERLAKALSATGVSYQIHYAMKANRHAAVLSHLRSHTNACIDVCSPRELQRALEFGFEPWQITYTNTSVSERDLDILAQQPAIALNLDALSTVRRFAQRVGARDIGIRINADVGMAYEEALEYAGRKTYKFGVYKEQWAALKQLVEQTSFRVTTVHCHAGSGFLNEQLERLSAIFAVIDQFIALFPTVETVNLGGGLGVPQQQGDQPLDLSRWAHKVATYANERGLALRIEPGDYLVKDAGVLITQVNTLEHKRGKLFVGVDAGMNVNYEPAYYQMNLEPVGLQQPIDGQVLKGQLAGNINEPIDLLSAQRVLPSLQEGDYLALLHAGGYGASASSDHCMRGDFREYVLYNKQQQP
jgi:diaminopimelate decarboxylase